MATVTVPAVGKVDRRYVIVGALAVVGIVGWAYLRRARQPATVYDPAAGTPEAVAPGTGYDNPVPDADGSDYQGDPRRADWNSRAVTALVESNVTSASFAATTIGRYLSGQPLTPEEVSVVQAAWGLVGYPDPYVPIVPASDAPGTGGTDPAVKPGRVVGLRVAKVSTSAAELDWNPPTSGGRATGYQVQRVTPTTGSIVRTDGTEYTTYADLRPATHYTFQVRATNRHGAGPWSRVGFTTKR